MSWKNKYVACKKCGFKMNVEFPLFDSKDLQKHDGLCIKCWNKEKAKRDREKAKERKEKRIKRASV